MKEENCPCCHNHCPKDNLNCGRGREYFNKLSDEPKTIGEEVINDLIKCGHMLHHNKELNNNDFLSNLSNDELEELHKLLTKISN